MWSFCNVVIIAFELKNQYNDWKENKKDSIKSKMLTFDFISAIIWCME